MHQHRSGDNCSNHTRIERGQAFSGMGRLICKFGVELIGVEELIWLNRIHKKIDPIRSGGGMPMRYSILKFHLSRIRTGFRGTVFVCVLTVTATFTGPREIVFRMMRVVVAIGPLRLAVEAE